MGIMIGNCLGRFRRTECDGYLLELKGEVARSWLGSVDSRGCAGGDAKDFTALGGKVSSAGAGVEAKEGKGIEIGIDGVKLFTLGVGEVDKDAVLQPGKAEIDRLKAASQEVVFKILALIGSLGCGGVEPPGLGLVKQVVNELDELAAGLCDFGDHWGKKILDRINKIYGIGKRQPELILRQAQDDGF